MATLRMAAPWKHPKTGIYHLRVRIPQRLRAVSGQSGEQFKLTLGTKDLKAAKAAWPDKLATWNAKLAEWERKLNAVVLTSAKAEELAAAWAAWISADLSRLNRSGVSAVAFDETGEIEAAIAHALGGPDDAKRAEIARQRLCAHAAEAARLAEIEVAEESAGLLHDALRPVVAAAYRQAFIRDQGVTVGQGEHWNPLEAAREKLPPVAHGAPLPAPAHAAVSLVGLFQGWKATATVKPRTIEETRYHVDLLTKHIGHDDAAMIDQAVLRGWRDEMLAAGRTNNTFNNRLSMSRTFVSYLRVSTDKQGKSGLGLEAQQAAILAFVQPGDRLLAPPYVEVESGKNSDRPKLRAALDHCRKTGATLLIARLDRLARSVRFISALMEEGIPFLACDMPNATPFMLHVYAAVAEEEARAISRRTKVALAAAKARGVVLGGDRGYRPEAAPDAALGGAAVRRQADHAAFSVAPQIDAILAEMGGTGSLQAVARTLNARGIATPRGGAWTATAVKRAQARIAAAA